MDRPFLFDAVLFDLDGTLVATDRFWIEAAERGCRRAFAVQGIERPLPTASDWMSLVGLPLEVGFRRLFPDLSEAARRVVLQACTAEEMATLDRDGAPAMPGVRETLTALSQKGARIGIASNCTLDYLRRMVAGLGVESLLSGAYCAESPGITSKADMIERLLVDLDARTAVMVGDRVSDRDAAWDNGLAHVHCAFGFAQGDERVECEGRIASLAELPALLGRREAWIRGLARELGLLDRSALRVGISGSALAGKTLLARDLARVLRAQGRPAEVLGLAGYATGRSLAKDESDPLGQAFDLERLQREVLAPHERNAGFDLPDGRRIESDTTLVLEGPFLLGARRRVSLDRLVLLEVSPEARWRRLAGRNRRACPGPLPTGREFDDPSEGLRLGLERRFPPLANADRVVDATNPLGPPPNEVPRTPAAHMAGGAGLVRS